jgi:competence protein ComEC
LLWTYAVLTGFSPSVIRAVFTFSLLALAQLSGKNYHPINILFFSALILLVIEPLFIFDIGFQLSYLAMIGIYLVYEPIYNWFTPKNLILNYFWQGTAVGFAAQVMTIPLMLYYFHQFPNYFILSNLILLVLSGIILGSGMSLFVTWKIPVLNKINVFVLFIALWFSLVSLTWIESLPGAVAYGFEFPFIIVPLMTISIYLLIYFLPFSKLWIATALMFTLLLSWVIILRWENLSTSHLVFFNHSKLTFALKNKDNIHCFVDAKPEDLKKSTFLLDAYSKCYPGNITWHSIKGNNGLFIVGSDTLKWQSLQDQKIITWKNSEIRVQFSATGDHEEVDIFMPWIEHPKSLKQGAIFYN